MNVCDLKEYIYENGKIPFILDSIGCKCIVYHADKEYYSATQPDGDNRNGVIINNNKWLSYVSYSRNIGFDERKDLLSLIEDVKHYSFIETVKYIHGLLSLPLTTNSSKQTKPRSNHDIIVNTLARYSSNNRFNALELQAIDESILEEYIPILHFSWFKEGIMYWTQKKFGLAYSYKKKRIIIPIRSWLTGELVGINARTTVENYQELGIPKYFITPTYKKSQNIYGLWENYDDIIKEGKVVVFEGEKSVLKRDSLGDATCVAIQGHSLSDEQARILIGLNVEIIFAMDSDVSEEEVRFLCNKVAMGRKVSYVYDDYHLLNDKESIADRPELYSMMLSMRKEYSPNE